MGAEIITTNQTSQYVIGSNDFVVLMPDVTLTVEATTAPGFLADHDDACTLTILGQVVTFGSAALIGKNSTGTMLATVTVGKDGLLQSLTGFGVDIRRSGSRIDNDGVISGGNAGVHYGTGVNGAEIVNSGTISSLLGYGIGVTGAAGGSAPSLFEIVNTGLIEAETNGVSVAFESLELTNHGDIIAFGTGISLTDDPALDNTLTLVNTGLVQGDTTAVDATGHADIVTNSGTLLGAVLLHDGDNQFDNSGTTAGAVSAGTGADSFTNAGVVTGAVDLGGGANRVTNHGRLEAGLVLADGDDTLLSDGTILGDVHLGDGNNTATLTGAVHGSLQGGANADRIEVRGQIAGDVSLGNGADSLVFDGRIDGDVDMGTGTDIVWLGEDAQTVTGILDGGSGEDTLYARIDIEDVFNFEIIHLEGAAGLGVVADAIANTIYGTRADDEIDGGDGGDKLFGRSGADILLGGLGADVIKGGRGADELIGGAGSDTLKGARGKDTFVYEAATDSLRADADTILDFERGRDKIDLTDLVEGTVAWLATDGFTGKGAAEARYRARSDRAEVKIDVDGDGNVDMMIVVEDLTRLTASDFLL